MSILISGDFKSNYNHGIQLVTKKSLVKKYGPEKYNGIKYHVILGDANFMWPGNEKADKSNYEALSHRPFPILCVLGNEDPILGISDRLETDIGIGETVYQIQDKPFVAYLKRGKAYTIDGLKILVLGGAKSLDKKRRLPGITWWPNEYWTQEEQDGLFRLLETVNSFDLVISHTGPYKINKLVFYFKQLNHFDDEVAFLNDKIDEKIQFREWLCGHWFSDDKYFDAVAKKKYQYFFDTTKIIELVGNRLMSYPGNEIVEKRGGK